MTEQDVSQLSDEERNAFGLSMQPGLRDKHIRNILLSGAVSLLGVCLFSIYGMGIVLVTALAVVLILIATVEKISYSREILVYRSLVRGLTRRIDALEGAKHPASLSPGTVAEVLAGSAQRAKM